VNKPKMTKPEMVSVIVDRFDPVSMLEKKHLQKNLQQLKPKVLRQMIENLRKISEKKKKK
jgi:hypothetical protein